MGYLLQNPKSKSLDEAILDTDSDRSEKSCQQIASARRSKSLCSPSPQPSVTGDGMEMTPRKKKGIMKVSRGMESKIV